jgi:hypothetical protein
MILFFLPQPPPKEGEPILARGFYLFITILFLRIPAFVFSV